MLQSFVVLGTGRLLGVSTVLLRGLSQQFTDMPLVRYTSPLIARHQMLLILHFRIVRIHLFPMQRAILTCLRRL
jgi:hypothetical protein